MSDESVTEQRLESALRVLELMPDLSLRALPSAPRLAQMMREDIAPEKVESLRRMIDTADPMPEDWAIAWGPVGIIRVFQAIEEERDNQDAKWGAARSLHPSRWLTILTNGVDGVNETIPRDINKAPELGGLRAALVAVAAVAVAQIEQLDREVEA